LGVIRVLRRQAIVLVLLAGGLCLAAAAARADPGISAKRAQAQRILGELQRLDASAQRANNRYEEASRGLRRVERQLAVNRQALGVARVNLVRGKRVLAKRLVAIYTSQDQQSSLAVILGARSLNDLISRIEAVNSVSHQDSALIRQVLAFQHQIVRRRGLLRREQVRQKRLVVVRRAAMQSITGKLHAEQHLYSSVKSEIDRLVAQQHQRQLAAARAAKLSTPAATVPQVGGLDIGAAGSTPAPSSYGSVVSIALHYLGVPYVWGGASPSGFDCSGFVMYVYAQVGISLPHYTVAQWDYPGAVSVPRDQLEPGDLVFFYGLGHVGIYIGNGQFVHAPHTGDVVRIDSLNESWYAAAYYGAKRILH
jgi:cell wall-associated NlpC family hydrolase